MAQMRIVIPDGCRPRFQLRQHSLHWTHTEFFTFASVSL